MRRTLLRFIETLVSKIKDVLHGKKTPQPVPQPPPPPAPIPAPVPAPTPEPQSVPTPEELSLGNLTITVTSHGDDPAEAKFDLPNGSSVTREIPAEGLAMKLGLGLGLSYVKGTAAGGGYVGPIDLVSGAVSAYGQRAMSAADIGSTVYTIRRDSDDVIQAFVSGADGSVNAAAVTAFLGAANGFVNGWHDKGLAAENAVNAVVGTQPQWVANVQGGKPGLGGVGELVTVGDVTLPNGAYTIFMVCSANGAARAKTLSGGGSYVTMKIQEGNTQIDAFNDATGNEAGGRTNDFMENIAVFDAAWEFGSKSFRYNGAALSFASDFDSSGAVGSVAGPLTLTFPFLTTIQYWQELIIYPSRLSDADRLLVRQNMAAYYGITLS